MPKICVKNRSFFYEDIGVGEPIVFLSGLGGDHRSFSVTVRAFAKSHRAIAIDHRDVGQSDRSAGPYNVVDLADDTASILRGLGLERAHVVGQSLGGLIAQELTLCHPDLVKSLVLVSTHAGANAWRKAVIESWIAIKTYASAAEFARSTLPWLVAPDFYHNIPQIEGLVRFAERNEWPQAPEAFTRQARAAIGHETRSRLHKIAVPTMIVVGELDLINPLAIAQELANSIPDAGLQVMPKVGHLPHIEDGQRFRQILQEFLGTLG